MDIRPLAQKDRGRLHSMLTSNLVFTSKEIDMAMELIDVVLKDPNQKDYEI